MNYDKQAVIFEYVDLIFTVLIILLLVIFTVIFTVQNNNVEEQTRYANHQRAAQSVQGGVLWQAGFLANSITNYPVDDTSFALWAQQANESEIQQMTNYLLSETRLQGHKVLYAVYKNSTRYSCATSTVIVPGSITAAPSSVTPRSTSTNACDNTFIRANNDFTHLREPTRSAGWTITPGVNTTTILVMTYE